MSSNPYTNAPPGAFWRGGVVDADPLDPEPAQIFLAEREQTQDLRFQPAQGYWLNTYFMLKSLDVTMHFTLANALGVLIFSTLGVIVPLPGGAGVWGTLAYGLTLIYGLPQDQANTFGIYSVAVSNLLMIVFGSISYLLLYLDIQKASNNEAQG